MKLNIKNKSILWLIGIIFIGVGILAIPLPFKPSIWTYLHRQQLNETLASFSEPLYIAEQSQNSDYSFQTYLGWKNSYAVTGYTDTENRPSTSYTYIQASKTGYFGEAAEGPSSFDLDPLKEAMSKT